MNYENHSKHRKIRYRLSRILWGLSFSFLHLSASFRVVILGNICILASLFFPWFSIGKESNFTPFSSLLGRIGYMFFFLCVFLSVALLSRNVKEYIKNRIGVQFSDHALIVFFGMTQVFLLLAAFSFMQSLIFFTKDIEYYRSPIVAFIGAIFVVGWGILSYRESKREVLSTLYIENSQTSDALFSEYEEILKKKGDEKKNMSLPV